MNTTPQKGINLLDSMYPKIEKDRIEDEREKNEQYIIYFKKEKQDWNYKLQQLFETIYQDNISKNNAKPLINAQAMSLTYRQTINEKISDYANTLTAVKAKSKELSQVKFLFYATNFGLKLNMGEKKLLIEGNLRENSRQSQILETHIEYLRESVRTLETFSYSVKNIIALMDYLGK